MDLEARLSRAGTLELTATRKRVKEFLEENTKVEHLRKRALVGIFVFLNLSINRLNGRTMGYLAQVIPTPLRNAPTSCSNVMGTNI